MAMVLTLVPANVSAPVNPPSRTSRSVEPPTSCFLNSTKPGRSKKNGSSRGPTNDLPPPLMDAIAGRAAVGGGAAGVDDRAVPAIGASVGAGGALDDVVLDGRAVGRRAMVAEPDAVGDVRPSVAVGVDLELVQGVAAEPCGLGVGRAGQRIDVHDEGGAAGRLEGVDVGDVDARVGLGGRGVEVVGGAHEERAGAEGRDEGRGVQGARGRTSSGGMGSWVQGPPSGSRRCRHRRKGTGAGGRRGIQVHWGSMGPPRPLGGAPLRCDVQRVRGRPGSGSIADGLGYTRPRCQAPRRPPRAADSSRSKAPTAAARRPRPRPSPRG